MIHDSSSHRQAFKLERIDQAVPSANTSRLPWVSVLRPARHRCRSPCLGLDPLKQFGQVPLTALGAPAPPCLQFTLLAFETAITLAGHTSLSCCVTERREWARFRAVGEVTESPPFRPAPSTAIDKTGQSDLPIKFPHQHVRNRRSPAHSSVCVAIPSLISVADIALRRLTAVRGLIISRWQDMATPLAIPDACRHLVRTLPPLSCHNRANRASHQQPAASNTLYRRVGCPSTLKAAICSVTAAAGGQGSAAIATEAAMTKYGDEQEAACRAVRLAAKLCQACSLTFSRCTPHCLVHMMLQPPVHDVQRVFKSSLPSCCRRWAAAVCSEPGVTNVSLLCRRRCSCS